MANTNPQPKISMSRKSAGSVLRAPRITEKGAIAAGHQAYIFTVAPSANKKEIARAIEEMFKVRPRGVRIVRTAGKRKSTRGTNRFGHGAGEKKAYVYLNKGDSIDLA